MIDIPTENDFKALPDMVDEALENNRRYGLPAKPPTEITREGLTWSSTTPAGAKAWVDDMMEAIKLMLLAVEIDGWEQDNERSLGILHKYFPGEYERICDLLMDARENAKTLRW